MIRFAVRFSVSIACAGLVSTAAAQSTPPNFAQYQSYAVGSWPESAAIGDFDSDGRQDVALTTSSYFDPANDFKVFVFRQNASGGLVAPPIKLATHGVYSDAMDVAAADFNRDGATDLAVCTSAGIDLYVQRNRRLHGPLLLATALPAFGQDVADVTGDGRPDIVVRAYDGISVFVNVGHSFQPTPVTPNAEGEIELGDVTGDGLVDIVGYIGNTIHVYAQQSGGTWSAPTSYTCTVGYWPVASGIGLGDVTGDGLADVVATIGGNQPGALVNVFAQLPNGTLASPVVYPSYDIPEPVEVADVNGDGRKDVIALHGGWLRAGVYCQSAQGTLMPEALYPIPYASHYGAKGLDIGDVSGDGLADIVLADYGAGLVVLRQLP